MALFGWLRAPRAPVDRSLLERIELLEDDYARLERRFESLRGSVTGALSRSRRRQEDLQLVEQLEDPDQVDPDDLEIERLYQAARARRAGGGA